VDKTVVIALADADPEVGKGGMVSVVARAY